MNRIITVWAVLLTLTLPLPPGASAAATGGCHCFRDRAYDPAHPHAADDYLLATTVNSLIAGYFHVSKRQIIMDKMQGGRDGDDLLIGLYLAPLLGQDPSVLWAIRDNGGSWARILASSGAGQKRDPVFTAIRDDRPRPEIRLRIVRVMVSRCFGIGADQFDTIIGRGFSPAEAVLLAALHDFSEIPISRLMDQRRQGRSWSRIAHDLGLSPVEVGQRVEARASGR